MRVFYDNTVKIKRYKSTGTIKSTPVSTATADACIQPLGKEGGTIQDGVFGETYQIFMDVETTCQKGDLIVDRDGNQYSVTTVIDRSDGPLPHKNVIVKKT